MQKTTLAKLGVLSRELMRVVDEFNDILEEEGYLYAVLNDEEEDCSIRAEMNLLEDMRSDFFVVADTVRENVVYFTKQQKERGDE